MLESRVITLRTILVPLHCRGHESKTHENENEAAKFGLENLTFLVYGPQQIEVMEFGL